MDSARWKKLFYFSLAVLMAIFLVWFGSKFLFWPADQLSSVELFLAGAVLIISAIYLVSTTELGSRLLALGLTITGFYFFARAGGIIEMPWLARIIGVACWLAASLILYITWPSRNRPPTKKDTNASLKT